jgi:hypothetical protein
LESASPEASWAKVSVLVSGEVARASVDPSGRLRRSRNLGLEACPLLGLRWTRNASGLVPSDGDVRADEKDEVEGDGKYSKSS